MIRYCLKDNVLNLEVWEARGTYRAFFRLFGSKKVKQSANHWSPEWTLHGGDGSGTIGPIPYTKKFDPNNIGRFFLRREVYAGTARLQIYGPKNAGTARLPIETRTPKLHWGYYTFFMKL